MNKNWKHSINLLIGLLIFGFSHAQNGKIKVFDLADLRLHESDYKNAQEVDLGYIMQLNLDKLLAPFLREAGLTPKEESYPNWENTESF